MTGIDMNRPYFYNNASLRFFDPGECHVNRYCGMDVLLLVYDGVLRFSEDGVEYEVAAGEYFIQRKGTIQRGNVPSDAPKYLYIHFLADWTENGSGLPRQGNFDIAALWPLMERIDRLCHSGVTMVEQMAVFFEILSELYRSGIRETMADRIASYIVQNIDRELSLDRVAEVFHFSKNHIINVFRSSYHMTPFEYMNRMRICRAEWLLEVTSRPAGSIAAECGYKDYSHFYKMFCRVNGVSPIEWRRMKRLHPSVGMEERTMIPLPEIMGPAFQEPEM